MRMQKRFVMANPYAHIDANGRLAGATPLGEHPRHASVPPAREYVGATRVLLEHDMVGRGIGAAQQPRSEYMFVWGAEPVEVDASKQLGPYYAQLVRDGDLIAADKGEVPLKALAAARAAAFARFKAETGEEPSAAEWSQQFPLDGDVAMAMSLLADQVKADAERATADAKAAAEKAKADAEREKAEKAERAKAKAASDADRKAAIARQLGIPPGPAVVANEPPKTTARTPKES